MQARAEAIAMCLRLNDAFEDYPFEDTNWTCMRRKTNRKIFAAIYERNGNTWINVKAEPLKVDFWQAAFPAVLPGWHMNKRHWISILLDGSMDDEDIFMLINESYQLVASKKCKKKKEPA